jgi:hypothetical protein
MSHDDLSGAQVVRPEDESGRKNVEGKPSDPGARNAGPAGGLDPGGLLNALLDGGGAGSGLGELTGTAWSGAQDAPASGTSKPNAKPAGSASNPRPATNALQPQPGAGTIKPKPAVSAPKPRPGGGASGPKPPHGSSKPRQGGSGGGGRSKVPGG